MDRKRAIAAGAVTAAVITHGLVYSAMHLEEPLPITSYLGFFQNICVGSEQLWSALHGWPSWTHVPEFGHTYALAIQMICPIIAFALFWILSQHRVGRNIWKPIAIAVALGIPTGYIFSAPIDAQPWLEVGRTVAVFLLMVGSVLLRPVDYAGATRTSTLTV